MVGFGDAEQVGDHQERERVGVVVHEFAFAPPDELVDLAIGELPHELLVLLEALRRDQPQQQPRCAVCLGGSNDGNWSLNGSESRCSSMMALMSSPSSSTGNFTNGPATVLHDENVAASL